MEFWEFTAEYYVYIANRTQSPRLNKTLYKEWFSKKLDVSKLKAFRSIAQVTIPTEPEQQHKLLGRVQKGILVGYKGSRYRIQDLTKRQVVVSNHVKAHKNKLGSNWLKELVS